MTHWKSEAATASEKCLNLPQNRRNSLLRASQETLLQLKFAENFCFFLFEWDPGKEKCSISLERLFKGKWSFWKERFNFKNASQTHEGKTNQRKLSEDSGHDVKKKGAVLSKKCGTEAFTQHFFCLGLLRYDSKTKFYGPSTVQPLTEAHMEQRRKFFSWLLEQPANFTKNVFWTDEKIFVLNPRPNRKNDGVWCKENPHDFVQTNDRNGQKIMIFVAIVDGQIPIAHAFDKSQTVNGASYLVLLKEVVLPAIRYKATRKGYWWMQDGASPHCTSLAKDFIIEKFQDRVINRGTPIILPAHSPDLNPLDLHFWGMAQQQVYQEHPETIERPWSTAWRVLLQGMTVQSLNGWQPTSWRERSFVSTPTGDTSSISLSKSF